MTRVCVFGLGVVAVLVACTEPTPPARSPTYAFDYLGDVFVWPAERLPVRFFADPRGPMPALVARAIDLWERQFLYAEFRGVLVADSNQADVIVLWADSVPADVPPDPGPPVFACDGQTIFQFDTTGITLAGPVHAEVGIQVGFSFTAAQVSACVHRIAVHEIGHTIGLLSHSPFSGDIMWASDTAALPSNSDRRTVEVLYHSTPTIAPFPR